MFTGIIQAVGKIAALESKGEDLRMRVLTGKLPLDGVVLGDSIAVNGVCLTAVDLPGDGFWADVSGETLAHTTLGNVKVGTPVNLEKALTLATPLGGHLVSGHVDGVGTLQKRWADGRSERFRLQVPAELARYIAQKGSVCIDGVSLTVNTVQANEFELNIVPHTLQETTLGAYVAGTRVNIEVDLIARYIERLLSAGEAPNGISKEFLSKHGFVE